MWSISNTSRILYLVIQYPTAGDLFYSFGQYNPRFYYSADDGGHSHTVHVRGVSNARPSSVVYQPALRT
jgi:hypothetical protein